MKTCRWCEGTDEPHPLNEGVRPFARYDECLACNKQKQRRPCGVCGGPFYVKGEVGCRGCYRVAYQNWWDEVRVAAEAEAEFEESGEPSAVERLAARVDPKIAARVAKADENRARFQARADTLLEKLEGIESEWFK